MSPSERPKASPGAPRPEGLFGRVAAPPEPAARQRGFTMVLLLALIVVMGIMLATARPPLKALVQRENEEELIFRGEAIARALKAYQAKFNKYPTDLDEVMKVRPSLLRKKYRDPMTPDGEWDYLTQVQPGASGETKGLPIIGVRSRISGDGENAYKLYKNKSLISDWRFLADESVLGAGGGRGPMTNPGGLGGGTGGGEKGGGGETPTKPKE